MDVTIGGLTASAAQYSPTPTSAPATEPAPASGAGTVASAPAAPVPALDPDGQVVAVSTPDVTDVSSSKSKQSPSLDQVQKAVDDINNTLKADPNTSAVQFAIDPSSKKIVVQMIDTQNGKVISQYPSEEIIQMGLALGKKIGQLINQQA
jgi:uncharacterized FlaG/YvyC family protein